jgi:hypothetical protein
MCLLNTSSNRPPLSSWPFTTQGYLMDLLHTRAMKIGAERVRRAGRIKLRTTLQGLDGNQPASFRQTGMQQKQEAPTERTLKRKVT